MASKHVSHSIKNIQFYGLFAHLPNEDIAAYILWVTLSDNTKWNVNPEWIKFNPVFRDLDVSFDKLF